MTCFEQHKTRVLWKIRSMLPYLSFGQLIIYKCSRRAIKNLYGGVKLRPSVSIYGRKKNLSSITIFSHVWSLIIIMLFSTEEREREREKTKKKWYIIFSVRKDDIFSDLSFFNRTCAVFIYDECDFLINRQETAYFDFEHWF